MYAIPLQDILFSCNIISFYTLFYLLDFINFSLCILRKWIYRRPVPQFYALEGERSAANLFYFKIPYISIKNVKIKVQAFIFLIN
jgi:hypothetical protein